MRIDEALAVPVVAGWKSRRGRQNQAPAGARTAVVAPSRHVRIVGRPSDPASPGLRVNSPGRAAGVIPAKKLMMVLVFSTTVARLHADCYEACIAESRQA